MLLSKADYAACHIICRYEVCEFSHYSTVYNLIKKVFTPYNAATKKVKLKAQQKDSSVSGGERGTLFITCL